ncbi:hypothetical protein MOPEL_074_00290 [Mobilicoccus pelagius NBRC 104925]|uniref:Ribosomal protein mS38 C-terminal domain-containing protein n=1 Tax=Mobilicoccus pelagius NBRC 104925 TaxID=1089455 RepID=H5US34_9MICO|nr:hypothetical protein MOPEL_074_00290 [Mobilicoccus pelagius NBRC 104925]
MSPAADSKRARMTAGSRPTMSAVAPPGRSSRADQPHHPSHRASPVRIDEVLSMGSVIKKRRKRMAKKKHRKLLRKTRHQRRNKK